MMYPSDGEKQEVDDGSIPDFLKRDSIKQESESTMSTPSKVQLPFKAPETEAGSEAETPKAKVARKPAVKATGKGNGKAPAKVAAKAKAPVKAAAKAPVKAKAKGKAKAERQRDPAKLDAYGLRKGSIKSQAAAMYAKGKGATLAEVKEVLGSVQFNVLTELEGRGHSVEKSEVKNGEGRKVTRYKLTLKD